MFPQKEEIWWKNLPENICAEPLKFCKQYPSLQTAWAACERADWMIAFLIYFPKKNFNILPLIGNLFRESLEELPIHNRTLFSMAVSRLNSFAWQPDWQTCALLHEAKDNLDKYTESMCLSERKFKIALENTLEIFSLPICSKNYRTELPIREKRALFFGEIIQDLAWARATHVRAQFPNRAEWEKELKALTKIIKVACHSPV